MNAFKELRTSHKCYARENRHQEQGWRVYNYSPGTVALQILGENQYSHVNLNLDEAKELASALNEAVEAAIKD